MRRGNRPKRAAPSSAVRQPPFRRLRIPYPVYEMLWNGMALAVILRLDRNFKKDGLVFLSYLSFYSLGRFLFTFVRLENTFLGGLQQAQIIALLVIAASAVVMVYVLVKQRMPEKVILE